MKKIVIFIIIFVLIFCFFYYKNQKLGNTIIKLSKEKNIENILRKDLKYKAEVNVKVYSNKNENSYKLKIEENGEKSLIEAVGQKDISGLKIEKKNEDLVVTNTKLNLEKIYENYKEITDNSLFLKNFVKDYYETDEKHINEENEIIVKITLKDYNKYIKYKELYFDKNSKILTKMVLKDSSNNPKIIIEYTSIEIL